MVRFGASVDSKKAAAAASATCALLIFSTQPHGAFAVQGKQAQEGAMPNPHDYVVGMVGDGGPAAFVIDGNYLSVCERVYLGACLSANICVSVRAQMCAVWVCVMYNCVCVRMHRV